MIRTKAGKKRPAKRQKTEAFSINIRLERDEEDEEFYSPFGMKGEFDGVHNITAKINVNGEEGGVVTLTLIDRNIVRNEFYSACDAESAELQYISVTYFNSNGSPKEPEIKACDPGYGGVLYVNEIKMSSKFRNTRVQSLAMKKLLTETLCQPTGHCPWKIVLYICDVGSQCTPEEIQKLDSKHLDEFLVNDLRECLRIGFCQAKSKVLSNYEFQVFANYDMLQKPMKSEEEVANIKISRKKKLKPLIELNKLDKILREMIMVGLAMMSQILDKVPSVMVPSCKQTVSKELVDSLYPRLVTLIQRGASIEKSGVLHYAVVANSFEVIDLIIKLGGQKYINSLDEKGVTPLMIASSSAPGTKTMYTPPATKMIKKLLSLGADVNVKSKDGLTAYGYMLKSAQESLDFNRTLGMNMFSSNCEELEFLLRPWGKINISPADLQGIDAQLLDQTHNKEVKTHGFSSSTSRSIGNGVKGKIVRACDSEGKWTVQIDGREGKKISVRSKNLIFIMKKMPSQAQARQMLQNLFG